jgi:Uma2 family endonuclease
MAKIWLLQEMRSLIMSFLTLQIPYMLKLSEENFAQLAAANRDVRLERTTNGDLIIMPPTGGETGERNLDLAGQLWLWNRQNRLGKAFDSSTGFRLPNGAIRSPDVAWISLEKWESLTQEQRKKFLPLCPDFALELLSESDELKDTQLRMQEYLDNGLRLGWLIDPKTQTVEIYRLNQPIETLQSLLSLSGEEVLPEFVLDLQTIWQ